MNRTMNRAPMIQAKSLITVLVLACGCDDSIPHHQICGPTESSITLVNPAVSSFNAQIDQTGSITFRSWNGEWIGTDCDTELQFTARGPIHDGIEVLGVLHGARNIRSVLAKRMRDLEGRFRGEMLQSGEVGFDVRAI